MIKSNKNNLKNNAITKANNTAFVPFICNPSIILPAFIVDITSMATIIDNQRIEKRRPNLRKSSFNDSYYKSACFDTGISQFRQKPARSKKGNIIGNLVSGIRQSPKKKSHERMYANTRSSRKAQGEGRSNVRNSERGSGRSSGFSFPVPSFATLAVIAGTVIFSLIALNWDGIKIQTPNQYTFETAANDTDREQPVKKYAATGIPAISLPAKPEMVEMVAATTAKTPEMVAATTETGDLPPEMIESFKWSSYKVKKGDSVSGIAQKFGISRDAVIASNNIRNARNMQEGAVLRIPNVDGIPYQIKKGDSLSKIAAVFNVPLEVVLDVNDIKSDVIKVGDTLFIPGARMNAMDLKLALGELFIYPVRKSISSNFGWRLDPFSGVRSFHTGLDLRGKTGDTVKAAMDGTVSLIGNNRVYGQHIILSHGNGYKTLYAHLSAYSVKHGDKVIQGRKIGELGNTGLSTGPHLHFGIFKNGTWVNPLDLLN